MAIRRLAEGRRRLAVVARLADHVAILEGCAIVQTALAARSARPLP